MSELLTSITASLRALFETPPKTTLALGITCLIGRFLLDRLSKMNGVNVSPAILFWLLFIGLMFLIWTLVNWSIGKINGALENSAVKAEESEHREPQYYLHEGARWYLPLNRHSDPVCDKCAFDMVNSGQYTFEDWKCPKCDLRIKWDNYSKGGSLLSDVQAHIKRDIRKNDASNFRYD
jgi:ribosomal protein L37AE/L43A